jgi:putative ABC transport system permease protein
LILRLVWRAMLERRQRVGLAFAALTVSATLSTALLGLYTDLERKLRGQFYGYGANLVIAPAAGRDTLALAALGEAEKHGAAAPFLYSVQTVNDEPVVLAGVDFDRLPPLAGYWQIAGQRRPESGECLAGERVAERFRLRPGATLQVAGMERRVAGIVSTGAAEDSQVLLPLDEAAALAGLAGRASVISVRADSSRIEQAQAALGAAIPDAEVRILRAVVESEASVVLKIRGTLFLLTLLILVITVLCVMNNFGAVVYQRRKEIGILKAIGGADRRIAALFASEVAVLSLMGSLAGFGLGWIVARWLGWQIFHQPVPPRLELLPLVAAITVAVGLAATLWPLRQVRQIEPAVILRGE